MCIGNRLFKQFVFVLRETLTVDLALVYLENWSRSNTEPSMPRSLRLNTYPGPLFNDWCVTYPNDAGSVQQSLPLLRSLYS